MTRLFSTGAAVAAALTLATGIAFAGSSAMQNMHAVSATTVHLTAQNHSGQSGTATLTQRGNNVVVTLAMRGIAHGVVEPAHIHPGTCSKLSPTPKYPLTNAAEGTTMTTIRNVRLGSLVSGQYAINVHDPNNHARYVSCGNIR